MNKINPSYEAASGLHSMKRRCTMHDYQEPGVYMITLATNHRADLLGHLTGKATAPATSENAPKIILTPLGEKIDSIIQSISYYHPEIQVWTWIIK